LATDAAKVRTVAITGQGHAGKTSVADALVFAAGGNNRLGSVEDETSLFDTEPEEQRRRSTISTSLFTVPWQKHEVTLLDTPGQGNFILDARFALRGAAAMVLVIDPTSDPRAEVAKVWSWAREAGIPTLGFVNKLDRTDIDLDACLAAVGEALGVRPTLLHVPIGEGESFRGVASVVSGKAFLYDGDSGKCSIGDAPDDVAARIEDLKATLVEDAAEGDDELLEKYLDSGELADDEVLKGLKAALRAGTVLPVLCGSATANIGLAQLLDAITDLLPAPIDLDAETGVDGDGNPIEIAADEGAPLAGFVFKTVIDPHAGQLSLIRIMSGTTTGDAQLVNTVSNDKERSGHLLRLDGQKTQQVDSATVGQIVALAKLKHTHSGDTLADPARPVRIRAFAEANPAISFAVEAKKRGEEDKAMQGLLRMAQEDLALKVERDESSGEILLSGTGQLHVEVSCERLARKYGVEVELKAPKVPYRETIRKGVKAHGRLKKQTGGHGQFADCRIEVEPLARGGGFEFVDKIVGGAIPRGFIPAVEKGVVEALTKGTIAGSPVVDVKVTLYDGQYHDVDSSEMAFKTAGRMAFREAMKDARPCLLEPYVNLEVTVPDECMGDVMGDLNSRRAKVEGMSQSGHNQVIKAKVPMAEVLRYASDLTSMTSGRGSFELGFSHYEQLPEHLVDRVVKESGVQQEAE
jgi:elongation factor G